MSIKNQRNYMINTYNLRQYSRILRGEKFIPLNSLRTKTNLKKEIIPKKKKNNSLSTRDKILKNKGIENGNTSSSLRGIELNKVFRYSNSPRRFTYTINGNYPNENILDKNNYFSYRPNENENRNNFEDNYCIKEPNKKPFSNNLNLKDSIDFKNTLDLKNLLKEEYINGADKPIKNELINNYINEQQYQNSLPSKILDNEIVSNPRESVTFEALDYLVNRNKNKFNRNSDKKNLNSTYNVNKNKYPKNKVITFYEKFIKNNDNTINNKYINRNKIISNIINKNNIPITEKYLTSPATNRLKKNKDFESKINKTIVSLNNNTIKNNHFNETFRRNNTMTSKFFLKPNFDEISTNIFMQTFTPRKSKRFLTEFNYSDNEDNNKEDIIDDKTKQYLNTCNFLGIEKDGNRLNQLLKTIPRHSKQNKFEKYNRNIALLKFCKDKEKQNKNTYKKNNNLYILTQPKYFNDEFEDIMPPNKLIIKNDN